MSDLTIRFMGLELANPVLVGSSGLTATVDGIKACADAGAGAVVTKSLFQSPSAAGTGGSPASGNGADGEKDLSERDFLTMLNRARRAVSVPIIASLCCDSIVAWKRTAKAAWNAGADALQLNISVAPCMTAGLSKAIEDLYITVLEEIKREVNVPVSVKVNPYLTSMMRMAYVLSGSQAAALVLFNRFHRIDIDTEELRVTSAPFISAGEEMHFALRWIALLYGKVPVDLAAATGLHETDDVIKQLLAGAQAVELCSTLYRNGLGRIRIILDGLSRWMGANSYGCLDDFRGLLSQDRSGAPWVYERLQYAGEPLPQG